MAMRRRKKRRRQRPRVSGNRALTPERKYLGASASRYGPGMGRGSSTPSQRVSRIVRRGKPVSSPSEDSLPPAVARGLSKRGWEYRNGAWRPGRKPKPKRWVPGAPIARKDKSLGRGGRGIKGSRNPGWRGRRGRTERVLEPRSA